MRGTRSRVLNTAVDLVGQGGIRALTHGRIDTAAGIAPGSTSNHFRTRSALVTGVIEWIASSEREDVLVPEICSEAALVTGLTHMIQAQSGPHAGRTRARYALFLEADVAATRPLREQRAAMVAWLRGILTELGGAGPADLAPFLMATCEGVLLHRLTVDPDAEVAAVIRRAVAATLRP